MVAQTAVDAGPAGGALADSGLRKLLLDAAAAPDAEGPSTALGRALDELECLRAQGCARLGALSPELLLLCAEAALKVRPQRGPLPHGTAAPAEPHTALGQSAGHAR